MRCKIIVALVLAVVLTAAISIAASVNPESPFMSKRNNKVSSLMSEDDGATIIKSKYPHLSSNLKFIYTVSVPDNSNELLQYKSDEAEISLDAKDKVIGMLQLKKAEDCKSVSIDLEKAKEIAVAAVAEYRPDINLTAMTQTVAELHNYGSYFRYRFLWYEINDDVYTGTRIMVELNGKGDLKAISANRNSEAAKIDMNVARISRTQAGDTALTYLSIRMSQNQYNTLQIVESTKRAQGSKLYWVVKLSAHTDTKTTSMSSYIVIVDAETGEVIDLAQSV